MPDQNESPLDQSLIAARSQMRQFYQDLEYRLKNHPPIVYAPYAARRLKNSWGNRKMMGQSPPHFLLHSIEANCAYARGYRNKPVGWNDLAKVMNVYHKYPDPLQLKMAQDNLILFALVMHREQMEIQYAHSREAVVRARLLFVVDNPIPRLSEAFVHAHGMSIEDWLRLSFITYATAHRDESGCFKQDQVRGYEHLNVAATAVDRFFTMTSATPKFIGNRYRTIRQDTQLQLHSLIRSVFLEYPIIDFGDQRMLAPHAELILRNSGDGLYRALRDLPHFDADFGCSVQRYIGRILSACHDNIRILDDSQLEPMSPGKSCDFLLETSDAVVLVESKATSFIARYLTETAMLQDNSTAKVARGMEQVYTTAHDLRNGAFESMGVSREKPILGMIVTFGDLPYANSDWYFENIFLKRATKRLKPTIYPNPNMQRRPMVVSLPTLELLIQAVNSTRTSFLSLYDDKQERSYVYIGDWDAYLRSKLSEIEATPEPLPFIEEEFDAFFETMGVPR